MRFKLVDGFVLMTGLAIGNSVIASLRPYEMIEMWPHERLLAAFVANLLVIGVWLTFQQFMAAHRIVETRGRLLMQIVVYPLSMFAVGMTATSMDMLIYAVKFHILPAGLIAFFRDPLAALISLTIAVAACAVITARFVFRRFILPDVTVATPQAYANAQGHG